MKTSAIKKFRAKLRAGDSVYGLWVTLESPSITEMAVALGLDWVVIDAEHGHLDWKEIVEHLRAAVRSDTVAIVRVAELNLGLIKRVLDIGADGVIIPWVETADQLRQAVAFANYPPEGVRGIGAERATAWGQCLLQHAQEANENVLVIPLIETVTAGRNAAELSQVPGVDTFFFGPADYSSTAGFRGQWEGPGVAEQLLSIKNVLRGAGKHVGVMATSDRNVIERVSQGFQMIGLGSDCGLLLRSLRGSLAFIGCDRPMSTSLAPENPLLPAVPIGQLPPSMRPNRPEAVNALGSGKRAELASGVAFECLVGAHNHAHNLTTGITTFEPGAELSYHIHLCSESITVLRGRITVGVEGRAYDLGRLDNITIPRETAHCVENVSATEPAVVHVALATDHPSRAIVHEAFPKIMMMPDSAGQPGAERVTRYATAKHSVAGPNTEVIDFFNQDLLPGVEMSGGYALFQPEGRLPAHVHDFDESICIIDGVATCVVEGRRYAMADCSTALQPRGRVHYFVNESSAPMAMIWVYGNPTPDRIVVDENCATVEGNPWK
jgi:2-keto-3-deoxy-L-rhamnonate aldolase RhmA/quercetin dioxygenase-like cupin family protein